MKKITSKLYGELAPKVQGFSGSANSGKTLILINDAIDVASKGNKVLFISLEMTLTSIMKYIYRVSTREERIAAGNNLIIVPMSIGCTVNDIMSLLRRHKSDVIFLDYIGLLSPNHSLFSKKVDYFTKQIQVLSQLSDGAKKYDTAVVTAFQTSKSISSQDVCIKNIRRSDGAFFIDNELCSFNDNLRIDYLNN